MADATTEHLYWDDRSETFDDDTLYIVGPEAHDRAKEWLPTQFSSSDSVVELGCGTGAFSAVVAPVVRELVATDMSERMLEQARAKLADHSNVQFQRQDAYQTTFDKASFDAVFMVNLLHIVDKPALILQECGRILRDGGKVVAAGFTSQGTSPLAGLKLGFRYLRRWGRPPSSGRNISLNRMVRLTEEAGFVVKEQVLLGAKIKTACVTGVKLDRPTGD